MPVLCLMVIKDNYIRQGDVRVVWLGLYRADKTSVGFRRELISLVIVIKIKLTTCSLLILQEVVFQSGNKLQFLFHSDGSNNEWGYKFKVDSSSLKLSAKDSRMMKIQYENILVLYD